MKKTILISFLLLSCVLFYAQGTSYNLGFSQVINYEYSSTNVQGDTETTVDNLVVPSGKVWKITSGTIHRNVNNGYQETCLLLVNQHVVYSVYSGYNNPNSNCPIWLSSGNYAVKFANTDNNSQVLNGSISIVEFNIE